jgi:hypothetical protein
VDANKGITSALEEEKKKKKKEKEKKGKLSLEERSLVTTEGCGELDDGWRRKL